MKISKFLIIFLILVVSVSGQSQLSIDRYPAMADTPVKNVILMIGDGMGIGHIASVRLKRFGKSGQLSMEKMPVTGIVNTYSADDVITDSAASATAMSTGYKTNNGMIGMSPDSLSLYTILEAAKEKGMKTGLIATSPITHATPAAFACHIDSRWRYNEIAEQLVNSGVDVMLGGGRHFFVPQKNKHSKREDDLDLIETAKVNGYDVVRTGKDLSNTPNKKILGLFSDSSLVRAASEPTLSEMTAIALDVLSDSANGFFLMVEGSLIDWEAHDNDFSGVQRELLAFDITVNLAVQFAMKNPGTLVIVTADHETGGLTINGGVENNLDIHWASKDHSGTPVGIFSFGPFAHKFTGFMDNTDIPGIIDSLLDLENFPQKIN